jgi:hypothetical protein
LNAPAAPGPLFARHLPPSASLPRVLALDPATAAELAGVARVSEAADPAAPTGPYDAVAGRALATAEQLAALAQRLRPGGRLILVAPAPAEPEVLLSALTAAGCIHCLVETEGAFTLYRGERPPAGGSTLSRAQQVAAEPPGQDPGLPRFIFLLVTQTPNKPVWRLAPGERLDWHAATVMAGPEPAPTPRLLAFSSLVKAVAYMQPAVLAGALVGVNKVAKFPASAAEDWPLPLLLNPRFEDLSTAKPGPPLAVEPALAITGEE